MRYVLIIFVALIPFHAVSQLNDTTIFYRLSSHIGSVIDSAEKRQCRCVSYVPDSDFEYAALKKSDSTIVLMIKKRSMLTLQEVVMYQPRLEALMGSVNSMPSMGTGSDSIAEMDLIITVFNRGEAVQIEDAVLSEMIIHIGGRVPDVRPAFDDMRPESEPYVPYVQKDHRFLLGANAGFGSFAKQSTGTIFIISNKGWGFGFSMMNARSSPINVPQDYFCYTIWPSVGSCDPPDDKFKSTSFYLVRSLKSVDPFLSISFAGFFSLVKEETMIFTPTPNALFSNYDTDSESRNGKGGGVRAMLDLNFSRVMGLQLAVETNINSINSFTSLEIGFIFGIVRDKLK